MASSVASPCVLASGLSPFAVTANLTLPDDRLFPSCIVFDAPHGIKVISGATLTINAGVTIGFGTDSTLMVNGGLVAAGTPCLPVVLTSDSATPAPGAWRGVDIATPDSGVPASGRLMNLVVQYGGKAPVGETRNLGAIGVDGDYADFSVTLANVMVSNNYGAGIVFYGPRTGPSPASSGTLRITDWGAATDSIVIFPNAADMLAPLRLSAEPLAPKADAGTPRQGSVRLSTVSATRAGGQAAEINRSETWPSIYPFSYVLGRVNPTPSQVDYVQSDGSSLMVAGPTAVTLTIASPNTLRLGNRFSIVVDPGVVGDFVVPGNGSALVANGSAGRIVFTSLEGSPTPGSWDGILLNYPGAGKSSIRNVVFDSAGAGIVVVGDDGVYPTNGGALELAWFYGAMCESGGPILENLTFTNLPLVHDYPIIAHDVAPATAMAYQGGGNTFPGASTVLVDAPDCQ